MPASVTVYPDWPESPDDLVPLPQCEGPKLKPFNFGGLQKIKFLEYVGGGLHSHVFKVEILGHIYALKLFRFCNDSEWLGPNVESDREDVELWSTFANYSEPFNSECRAFGRLQESDNCGIAIKCFGYVLLDEDHESTMLNQFMDKGYECSESGNLRDDFKFDDPNLPYLYNSFRSKFLGKNGRPPPIRGIVKEFGQFDGEDLRMRALLKAKRDMIALQQLGIIHVDIATRNLMDGKIVDFSTAITTPHYMTTPELNPRLTPEWISAMEFETFQFALYDYMCIENMVEEWNDEHELEKDKIHFFIFPRQRYELRKQSHRRLYTFVDPRLHDWRTFSTISRHCQSETLNGRSPQKAIKSGSEDSKTSSRIYRRLYTRLPRWYFDFDGNRAAKERRKYTHSYFRSISTSIDWEFKEGLIFPCKKV